MKMAHIISLAFKGIVRDRIFHGILFTAALFALVPSISSLSMRQGTELSITLSLSLISFILLLVSVFVGGTSLWRDIGRRYTFSVLSLPMSRTVYLVGSFLGIALSVLAIGAFLGTIATGVIWITSKLYPPEHAVNWGYISLTIFFASLKFIFLTAWAFFFSTFSTSFFLPVFGTITTYFAGSALQQVYEYIISPTARDFNPFIKDAVKVLYYLLPNLSSFDLHVYAIYGVPLQFEGILMTLAYFLVYTMIVMTIASIIFQKREIT